MLERATIENIRTWRFYKLDSGTFTTKFIYQIETKKKSLSPLNSKVELELPLLVKITTAPQCWILSIPEAQSPGINS